jgi:hypothetical protein
VAKSPKLKVEITATDHLSRELTAATRRVTRAAHVMRNVGGGAAKALGIGMAAAGAATWAAYKAIKSYSDEADSLSEASKKIGISADELQTLAFAAKRSGIEMDGLQSMLGTFSANLGKLSAGKGKLAAFIKTISPAFLKQLQGAGSPAEAIDLMFGAIERAETPAKKAALAVAAFGGEGEKLLDLLANGRDGLNATRREFYLFGRAITSVEAGAAENFNDAVDNVWTSLEGVRNEIGANLVPVLTPLANELARAISGERAQLAQRIATAAGDMAVWLQEVDWSAVGQGMADFGSAAWNVADALAEVVGNLDIIVDRTGAVQRRFEQERAPVAKAALARAAEGAASLTREPQTLEDALAQANTARKGQTGHVSFVPGAISDEVGIGTLALRQIGDWMTRTVASPVQRVDGDIVIRVEGNTDKVRSVRTHSRGPVGMRNDTGRRSMP